MMWIRGEAVTVWRPASTTYDERGDPVVAWESEHVENVLFDAPSTEDVDATMRAYGVRAEYKAHIPKAYEASLRGCLIVRDRDVPPTDGADAPPDSPPALAVAGDPQAYPPEMCPGDWNRAAMLGWSDG